MVAVPSGGAFARLITDGDDEIIEQQQADLVDVRLVSREVDAMMAAAAPAPAPAPAEEAPAPAGTAWRAAPLRTTRRRRCSSRCSTTSQMRISRATPSCERISRRGAGAVERRPQLQSWRACSSQWRRRRESSRRRRVEVDGSGERLRRRAPLPLETARRSYSAARRSKRGRRRCSTRSAPRAR